MIRPPEMKLDLAMSVANRTHSTTTQVWEMLTASYEGDRPKLESLLERCPDLIYAQYNYTPPIHFAVVGEHADIVRLLLERGALDPTYKN